MFESSGKTRNKEKRVRLLPRYHAFCEVGFGMRNVDDCEEIDAKQ